MTAQFTIVDKKILAPQIVMLEISAYEIANKANPGQFVVVICDEKGERIPLTIADWNKDKGSIKLIFQEVGFSTKELATLGVGDKVYAILGPLGRPTHLEKIGTLICIGGGVGIAEIFPVVRGFKQALNVVYTIIGSRTKKALILEKELAEFSDRILIATDDGTAGKKGLVTDVLNDLIFEKKPEINLKQTLVYTVGPVRMMQAIARITKSNNLNALVSLNPIMVDATGMCGACRVKVGGETRFACVDGPEFDAHKVDFENLLVRLNQHKHCEQQCKKT